MSLRLQKLVRSPNTPNKATDQADGKRGSNQLPTPPLTLLKTVYLPQKPPRTLVWPKKVTDPRPSQVKPKNKSKVTSRTWHRERPHITTFSMLFYVTDIMTQVTRKREPHTARNLGKQTTDMYVCTSNNKPPSPVSSLFPQKLKTRPHGPTDNNHENKIIQQQQAMTKQGRGETLLPGPSTQGTSAVKTRNTSTPREAIKAKRHSVKRSKTPPKMVGVGGDARANGQEHPWRRRRRQQAPWSYKSSSRNCNNTHIERPLLAPLPLVLLGLCCLVSPERGAMQVRTSDHTPALTSLGAQTKNKLGCMYQTNRISNLALRSASRPARGSPQADVNRVTRFAITLHRILSHQTQNKPNNEPGKGRPKITCSDKTQHTYQSQNARQMTD